MREAEQRMKIDLPTLVAISAVAWILVNVSHEVIGHAGMALLLGIPVSNVSTTAAIIERHLVPSIGACRLISAAGTLASLVGAVAALLLLRMGKCVSSGARYLLWLYSTFSFIVVAMNLVSLILLGGGDWAEFARGLEPPGLWKAMVLGFGVLIAIAGYVAPLRVWMPALRNHRREQTLITVLPLASLIAVQSLSLVRSPLAILPPAQNPLLACAFAYLHFVLWAILVNVLPLPRSSQVPESVILPRSRAWLALGLVLTLFYVLVIGPGLGPLGSTHN